MTEVPIGGVVLYLGAVAAGTISNAPNKLWQCGPGGSTTATTQPPSGTPALLPREWRVCDGSALLIAQYAALYGAIADVYNKPLTPTGYFCLPDLRGAFVRGVDAGAGVDPDVDQRTAASGGTYAGVGSMQCSAVQQHQHASVFQAGLTAVTQGDGPMALQSSNSGDVVGARTSAAETRPLNLAVHYIIRCW